MNLLKCYCCFLNLLILVTLVFTPLVQAQEKTACPVKMFFCEHLQLHDKNQVMDWKFEPWSLGLDIYSSLSLTDLQTGKIKKITTLHTPAGLMLGSMLIADDRRSIYLSGVAGSSLELGGTTLLLSADYTPFVIQISLSTGKLLNSFTAPNSGAFSWTALTQSKNTVYFAADSYGPVPGKSMPLRALRIHALDMDLKKQHTTLLYRGLETDISDPRWLRAERKKLSITYGVFCSDDSSGCTTEEVPL